jgi:hypothetical protein
LSPGRRHAGSNADGGTEEERQGIDAAFDRRVGTTRRRDIDEETS